ncbi:TPA: VOC family protein [Stenotrophomonas maltophilia]|uniref:VOC family protein n=1 Tax=Stenotrophomonas maltophilia TaxID=40324 RepID=UPI0007398169|nr:VOC family protein [Stenotrophomonas maltophilia]MBH1381471.1 VOC family protein [Stenotrophomonas maltophilia]MBH1396375.1 VOC family protein [Stenotrophomonas maltophilia]MBH1469869.1 VOC family protein [Stenotrophomonas maltophilia]MBH1473858.1 VOC family protein [Stenotrophomonas maltophilia]QJP18114.1 VOC family protein [Stenotrophomonas maltophilia]
MNPAAPHDAERRIDNIEFNVADIDRSTRFYGEVFGWRFTDYGPAYTEFDDGRLKGGFVADAAVRAHGGPLVILYCADLADAQQRVIAAGGEVVQAVFAFPGGRRFHFRDLDGYELAVWSDVD